MIRKIFLSCFICVILSNSESAIAAIWSNIHPSIIIANGYTTVGNAQNIWLANTPDPGLENNFSSGGNHNDTYLIGLALEKNFATKMKNLETAFGIEMDYVRNHSMTGIVQPMVNVAPDFDTLKYSYHMDSYLLLATAKLIKLDIISYFGAYLQAGAGIAINKLSDYTETSPDDSSAAPMLAPFGSASHRRIAYSIGAGIICEVSKSAQVLIGYRYINSGAGGFNTSPVQQTTDTLKFSPLGHHFFTVSLTV